MSKQLYEEALADVKKVKQVAEDNAKRAVLEAVTPRIREFIDQALLDEHMNDGVPVAPGAPPLDDDVELMTDLVSLDPNAGVAIDNAGPAVAMAPPDDEGKVTLDLDALCSSEPGTPVPPPMFGAPSPDNEYEISLESINSLRTVIGSPRRATLREAIAHLTERVAAFKKAGKVIRSSRGFHEQIAQMISRVEDMYDHVQGQVTDPSRKSSYENLLEASFRDLNKLQESTTMSQKKKALNEEDVTLKLTGLPDDIDFETVGVDLVTGDDEGEGDEEGAGDEGGDFDDFDLGGDQGGQEGEDTQMETRSLSDNTIVEIDEKMLRREIARMRSIRENHTGTGGSETKSQSWGNGADHFDSFGGGKDEGEFDEQDIVDKSPSPGALPLGEGDDDLDEAQAQMDEAEADLDEGDYGLDEIGQAVDGSQHGGNETMPTNKQSRAPGESFAATRAEGIKRIGFERKLQERAKARATFLKREAAAARARKNGKKLAEVKKEYALVARRFNESVDRAKKFTQLVATATRKLQEARSNSAAARPAEIRADDTLRKRLAETNLFNAKLLYTNKLLQNEQLTSRQKAQVIKQLDSAKTVREAKLVYDSLASTLAGSVRPMNEGRNRAVLGSGSRATRPASTQALNEGHEAERWARLAGITRG